jgi:iron complex outermembrane receptor protein
VKGNAVPNMPTVQGSGAISWTGQAGPGKLMLRAQYLYRGGFQSNVFQSAWYDKTPHYSQVNLFANYVSWARVLGLGDGYQPVQRRRHSSRFTDPYGASVFSTYIPPRQALVSVKYAF